MRASWRRCALGSHWALCLWKGRNVGRSRNIVGCSGIVGGCFEKRSVGNGTKWYYQREEGRLRDGISSCFWTGEAGTDWSLVFTIFFASSTLNCARSLICVRDFFLLFPSTSFLPIFTDDDQSLRYLLYLCLYCIWIDLRFLLIQLGFSLCCYWREVVNNFHPSFRNDFRLLTSFLYWEALFDFDDPFSVFFHGCCSGFCLGQALTNPLHELIFIQILISSVFPWTAFCWK